jgi:hypothetical protein
VLGTRRELLEELLEGRESAAESPWALESGPPLAPLLDPELLPDMAVANVVYQRIWYKGIRV